jgi:hypothetical protein
MLGHCILINIYRNQTFSKDKMEWLIMDDGRDKVEDFFIEAAKQYQILDIFARMKRCELAQKGMPSILKHKER